MMSRELLAEVVGCVHEANYEYGALFFWFIGKSAFCGTNERATTQKTQFTGLKGLSTLFFKIHFHCDTLRQETTFKFNSHRVLSRLMFIPDVFSFELCESGILRGFYSISVLMIQQI